MKENYYKIDFVQHPAEEGDSWVSTPRVLCKSCNRHVVPFANLFPTREDEVAHVDVGVWGFVEDPLVYCAGIVIVRIDIADILGNSRLTGFQFRNATVNRLDGDDRLADSRDSHRYRWMYITGRCAAIDVWRRVVGVCTGCGVALTEPCNNPTRFPRIRETFPTDVDICRAREDAAGILVSKRFRDFCLSGFAEVNKTVRFLPVEWADPV